jgi:hypothetical protein
VTGKRPNIAKARQLGMTTTTKLTLRAINERNTYNVKKLTRVKQAGAYKPVLGTVIGFNKLGDPIVQDDSDGLCIVDNMRDFYAMATPHEIAAELKRSKVAARVMARGTIKQAIRYATQDIVYAYKTHAMNVRVARIERNVKLAEYEGNDSPYAFDC